MDYKMIHVEINRVRPTLVATIKILKHGKGKSFSFVPPRFAYFVFTVFMNLRWRIDILRDKMYKSG